jgi:hypothetical protein
MELRRWTNPHQPQTLQISVFLLYIRAAFAIVTQWSIYSYWGLFGNLLAAAAMVFGGLGIANEKRWGYRLAVAVTALGIYVLIRVISIEGLSILFDLRFILLALMPAAQFALLLHPMSRQHQRVWFT